MSDILCLYYSRTGRTEEAMRTIASALGAEIVEITDDADRSGILGFLRSGKEAMKESTRPLERFTTEKELEQYRLIILGGPVWAGRCSSPVRALLKRRGLEMKHVAYLLTRASEKKYEEVFDQMDQYTGGKHVLAVSLRPKSVGYEFWLDGFIQDVKRYLEQ